MVDIFFNLIVNTCSELRSSPFYTLSEEHPEYIYSEVIQVSAQTRPGMLINRKMVFVIICH